MVQSPLKQRIFRLQKGASLIDSRKSLFLFYYKRFISQELKNHLKTLCNINNLHEQSEQSSLLLYSKN